MKLKLDENLGRREIEWARAAGHDALGVRDQGLGGKPDPDVIQVCQKEDRALVTLDRGFGNVLRFPPNQYSGIVILEVPDQASVESIQARLREFFEP